jgi:hypothetical protein
VVTRNATVDMAVKWRLNPRKYASVPFDKMCDRCSTGFSEVP